MARVVKIAVLVLAALVGLGILVLAYAYRADQARFRAAANPCERACIQDSGGIDSCRQDCASHPLTYGPAALSSAR